MSMIAAWGRSLTKDGFLRPVPVVLAGLPVEEAGAARFALRALGAAANEVRARALAGDPALLRRLEEAWAAWGVRGAALMELGHRLGRRLRLAPDLEVIPDPEAEVHVVDAVASGRCVVGAVPGAPVAAPEAPPLDATDPRLVLNVLGRTRGAVLIARAPLALEPGFLERELVSRDARLVSLARGEAR